MAKKKITQLDPATSVNSDALFPLSQEDNNEEKTFKGTIEQLGDYINKSQDFNTLNTTSKKVIGAINEVLNASGSDIITTIDTPAPIMSFSDGGDNIPVNALKVAVTAQQAGTGTPAPDNVRAITGWSQANLFVTKKTVVVGSATSLYVDASGVVTSGGVAYNDIIARVKQGESYTYSVNGTPSTIPVIAYFREYPIVGSVSYNTSRYLNVDATFTSPIDGFAFIRGTTDHDEVNQMVSVGSTVDAYENPTPHNITFNSTVYGGTLDVTNGKLTVTHSIVLDLGALSWTYNSSGSGTFRSSDISSLVKPVPTSDVPDFLCEMFLAKSGSDVYGGVDGIACSSLGTLWAHYGNETSVSNFVSAISGAKLVYELATPIEIALTPEQITTLSGLNNIYADCGDIQLLEYFNENADEIAELHRSLSDDFHIYSTAEQIVGKWIDGSDIYEKTWDFGSDISISYNSWTNTSILNDNFAVIVSAICRTNTGSYVGDAMVNISGSTYIQLQTPRNNNNIGVRYLTLRYTKAS